MPSMTLVINPIKILHDFVRFDKVSWDNPWLLNLTKSYDMMDHTWSCKISQDYERYVLLYNLNDVHVWYVN